MAKLTAKQDRFCDEYLIDCNGTQAAIRSGYSERTANRIASQLLAKREIQEAISERQKRLSENLDFDVLELKKRLLRNEKRAYDLLDLSASNKALELLGRSIGAFTDNINNLGDMRIRVSIKKRENDDD